MSSHANAVEAVRLLQELARPTSDEGLVDLASEYLIDVLENRREIVRTSFVHDLTLLLGRRAAVRATEDFSHGTVEDVKSFVDEILLIFLPDHEGVSWSSLGINRKGD